ncbi:MAG: DedA family protein [Actinomycetota bacterium]|nr:DedA family protein [Actinomycetota bacterium]
MDQWFLDVVSGSPWTYGLVFAIAYLDALIPIVPSETTVIAGGVVAAQGDLLLVGVIVCGALGAFLGDNTSYAIGDRLGRRAVAKFLRGERGRRTLEWGERMLRQHGGVLIVVARFIPGGRTATTFAAGTLGYPWLRRFVVFDAVGVSFWAMYAALVGYFGGKTFEESPWKALVLAFAIAIGLAALIEGIRRLRLHQRALRLVRWQGSQ